MRGYEEIKLRNVASFRQQAQALLERLDARDYSTSASSSPITITIKAASA